MQRSMTTQLLSVIAAVGMTTVCSRAETTGQPNIILMMADDLGWGDPQCFNPDSPIQTPHIDAMAGSGLKFTRFYSAAPVCSPTRGSCLTGRHPFRYGIYSANVGHLKTEEITLPELLRDAGYTTGHFGKWHLGTLTTEIKDANRGGPGSQKHFSPPQLHGYDRCFVTESKVPTFDPLTAPPNAPRTAWDFLRKRTDGVAYGTHYWDEKGHIAGGHQTGDDSQILMDRAIPFIESAAGRKQPFLAVVWFHAPHLPVVAGPDHVAPYAAYNVYRRNYYGCISALDEQVGRLRKKLRDLKIEDSTILWFTSDNGPEGRDGKAPGSAGPWRGRKRSLYEGGVRVPGIVEWPGRITSGQATDFPAVTSDYLPTVLDILDIPYPDNRPLDGISLVPLLQGRIKQRTSAIGFQSKNQCSWTTSRYKIYSANTGQSWELYDLILDPSEQTDQARLHPGLVRTLSADFLAWQASCRLSDTGRDYPRTDGGARK